MLLNQNSLQGEVAEAADPGEYVFTSFLNEELVEEIASKSERARHRTEHLNHLRQVVVRLRVNGLVVGAFLSLTRIEKEIASYQFKDHARK